MESPESSSQSKRIEIFQTFERKFTFIGIGRSLASQKYPINERILIGFIIFGSATGSSVIYIFYEAKDLNDYTLSTYILSVCILSLFLFAISIFKVQHLYSMKISVENLSNASQCSFPFFYIRKLAVLMNDQCSTFQHTNIVHRNCFSGITIKKWR